MNMEKEEILKKVIEKAVKNGWEIKRFLTAQEMDEFKAIGGLALLNWTNRHWAFLFDPSFAKAFFGKKKIMVPTELEGYFSGRAYKALKIKLIAWQFHIQQLAISEDKLGYLEKFL